MRHIIILPPCRRRAALSLAYPRGDQSPHGLPASPKGERKKLVARKNARPSQPTPSKKMTGMRSDVAPHKVPTHRPSHWPHGVTLPTNEAKSSSPPRFPHCMAGAQAGPELISKRPGGGNPLTLEEAHSAHCSACGAPRRAHRRSWPRSAASGTEEVLVLGTSRRDGGGQGTEVLARPLPIFNTRSAAARDWEIGGGGIRVFFPWLTPPSGPLASALGAGGGEDQARSGKLGKIPPIATGVSMHSERPSLSFPSSQGIRQGSMASTP